MYCLFYSLHVVLCTLILEFPSVHRQVFRFIPIYTKRYLSLYFYSITYSNDNTNCVNSEICRAELVFTGLLEMHYYTICWHNSTTKLCFKIIDNLFDNATLFYSSIWHVIANLNLHHIGLLKNPESIAVYILIIRCTVFSAFKIFLFETVELELNIKHSNTMIG